MDRRGGVLRRETFTRGTYRSVIALADRGRSNFTPMRTPPNHSTAEAVPLPGCVFCAIGAGTAPSRIVWETEQLLCFFPRVPEVLGHTLIASKAHFVDVRDAPISFGAHLFEASQRLAAHYERKLGATGFNLLNASGRDAEQSVPHLHFHFFPRFTGDDFSTWPNLPKFEVELDSLLTELRIT